MLQHREPVRTLVEQRRHEARKLWGSLRLFGRLVTDCDDFLSIAKIRYNVTDWRTVITRRERADERDRYR